MSENELQIVTTLLDAAQKNDMETVEEYTHPDCQIIEPDTLPYGGVYEGKDAFEVLFDDIWGAWATADFEPTEFVEAGDRIFVLWESKIEAPETGETAEMPMVEIYYVEDDLVRKVEVFYQDTAKLHNMLE